MSNNNRRHVVPGKNGGWDITNPDGSRASARGIETQAEAIARSNDIVRNAGGGEVVTHGKDGKIRNSNTIAPGNDPFPPKDTK